MARNEAIFLEEPPSEHFLPMLQGEMEISEYLMTDEPEYPEFSRRMCAELRRLHAAGKRLVQVEPYLEHLMAVHEFFLGGSSPGELKPGSDRHRVYSAERLATAALLDFYEVSIQDDFKRIVAAVIRFARRDADRFRLRDQMRAEALAKLAAHCSSAYVEAGQMHVALRGELLRHLPARVSVKTRYLMGDVVSAFGGRGRLYGPGDVLTLHYIYHPGRPAPQEDLLSARALIYNKIVEKNEDGSGDADFPHTRNEIESLRSVSRLSFEDCRRLYPVLRRLKTDDARRELARHGAGA